jgi:hypothetical protein
MCIFGIAAAQVHVYCTGIDIYLLLSSDIDNTNNTEQHAAVAQSQQLVQALALIFVYRHRLHISSQGTEFKMYRKKYNFSEHFIAVLCKFKQTVVIGLTFRSMVQQ